MGIYKIINNDTLVLIRRINHLNYKDTKHKVCLDEEIIPNGDDIIFNFKYLLVEEETLKGLELMTFTSSVPANTFLDHKEDVIYELNLLLYVEILKQLQNTNQKENKKWTMN